LFSNSNSLFEQRTFSFLEQRRHFKLSSRSLLMGMTNIAILLIQKNRKSSNIDPHSFTYICACFLSISWRDGLGPYHLFPL